VLLLEEKIESSGAATLFCLAVFAASKSREGFKVFFLVCCYLFKSGEDSECFLIVCYYLFESREN
jgi:hypothetical protein